MSNVLVATSGRATGSPASRRLRAGDHIPAVVYGHGMDPLSITVERRDLRIAVSGVNGMNTVLSLQVDGQVFPALIKELQRHPVRRNVSHIDFIRVNLDEKITVNVPLHLVGEAKSVLNDGGLVDPAVDHIAIETTPGQMPSEVTYDISGMHLGQVVFLRELALPAGCVAVGDPDMAVITAMSTSRIAAPVAQAEAPEGA